MKNPYDKESNIADASLQDEFIPDVLPILTVEGLVIFPYATARVVLPAKYELIVKDTIKANGLIGVLADTEIDGQKSVGNAKTLIGTVVGVSETDTMPDGNLLLKVKGLKRFRLLETIALEPYATARVEAIEESIGDPIQAEALRRRLMGQALEAIRLSPQIPDTMGDAIGRITSPIKLTYLLASVVQANLSDRLKMLRHQQVEEMMKVLSDVLQEEIDILLVSKSIDDKVQDRMSNQQREYHLRQKLEAIRKELGEEETTAGGADEYREKIASSAMSEEARKEAERELKRMANLSPQSAEYPVIQNYLDWLLDLPWDKPNQASVDIDAARMSLDRGHFGIKSVKERIIEYLAVHQFKKERHPELDEAGNPDTANGVILCLAGPPGTGKTSLAKSIAEAMNRKYTRMSLGGIRDESEVRGHRRTYVGAMPGRIVQGIKRAGSRNPVFVLDEIDKIGNDLRGDPSSALLEVLDPEQNANFRDHYLDVDFDLSEVIFIATANHLDTIPLALRDGDVMKESAQIAHSYIRAKAQSFGIDPETFETSDIHLHIPAGALPKDGPSAGVVMVLALASAYTGKVVPNCIGATGEITLRGRVLPVGGIKMKVLAAHRAGLTHIILPERNRADIDELPEEILEVLHIEPVGTMDEMISLVFPEINPTIAKVGGLQIRRVKDCATPECGSEPVALRSRQ